MGEVPEINAFLNSKGLGELADDQITTYVGRNDNWTGRTSNGTAVFVKRLPALEEAAERVRRSVAFDSAVHAAGQGELRAPRLLAHDVTRNILVFELLDEATTGADLAADEQFHDELARQAGRALGVLHSIPAAELPVPLETGRPIFPDLFLLDALPLPFYLSFTFAEVSLWNIIHGDRGLTEALGRLRDMDQRAPRRPTHCDLRLDQFLVTDDVLYLTDGEEFRLADPARDVGAFAGEWLHQAVAGLSGKGEDDAFAGPPTHEEIVSRGAANLDRLRPRIAAFWDGYTTTCADIDDELPVRATAFAGCHLFDRAVVTSGKSARLHAGLRAAMGIGRTALSDPERYVTALGLGDGS
ncbi:phosphotransferase [Nonomuraea phyllanthi]|uniref:Phosphotransferase n=1 Tax=Nonomuraea phyllanthi TaxID=2219224 RepID=A0A5C4WU66_9ACTN|nr:class V lanthionine synthetase subunit LxmK [Nonomuraea phyllanthi]KAB8197149.1 phosphotransferase [Nonomuraea phyllanthi]